MASAISPLQQNTSTVPLDHAPAKSWWQDILVLTVVFSLFFGAFLGSRPLTVPDEGRYAEIPREMVTSGNYITPRINGIKYFEKPPFFYWLQTASYRALGINEWAVRLPNALMALLGLLIVYATTRQLYNRRSGQLAAMTLGSFGLYAGMAHMVTLDMTVATLLSASFCCFLLGNQQPAGPKRNRFLWGMYACGALATLTKGLIGIAFPCLVVFTWLLLTAQWRELKTYCLPTGLLLLAAIAVPWHILVQLQHPEFFKYYIVDQQFLRYITDAEGRHQPLWFLPTVLLGGLFPWTGFILPAIVHAWPQSKRQDTTGSTSKKHRNSLINNRINSTLAGQPHNALTWSRTNLFLLLWAGLIFGFFWLSKSQLIPYVLPIYPPLAMLLGSYLDSVLDQPRHWGIRFGLAVMTLIILALLVFAWLKLPLHEPAIMTTTSLVALTAAVSLIAYWRSNLWRTLLSLVVMTSLFITSVIFSYPPTDTRPIKVLALTLKPLLKDTDIVYSFQDHFQDLPVYLGRRVVIIDFYGELWFGIKYLDHPEVWVSQDHFWQRWSKPSRQFMIMSLENYTLVLSKHLGPLYEIQRTQRNILVSNFPNGS